MGRVSGALLLLLLSAAPAWAQVAFDAANGTTGTGTSTISYSLTIGSGTNRAVAVAVSMVASTSITGVTLGGNALSLVAGTSTTGVTQITAIYCGATSLTGAQTIVVSFSDAGNSQSGSSAVSASGVDQTTPCNGGTSASGSGGVVSLAIASNSGDLTFEGTASTYGQLSAPTQTQQYLGPQTGGDNIGLSTGPGTAGPITHQWSVSSYSGHAVMTGANFKQASGAAAPVRYRGPIFQ